MYYIIHIATAYQSFKARSREIQELIWTRTQNGWRTRDPNHPILTTTLDQYLAKESSDMATLTSLLKTKMALTPEFGHIIALGKALVENGSDPKVKVMVISTTKQEKDLLENFWAGLSTLMKRDGIPTFVSWNGLEFTFPYIVERSIALGVEPACVLPRARFQPWKHMDLLAELGNYDAYRYVDLKSRLALWGLKLSNSGMEANLENADYLIEEWRKGNFKPLRENLALTIDAIHQILRKTIPHLPDRKNNGW